MSKKLICAISGSPFADSRTAKVVEHVRISLSGTNKLCTI